MSTIIRILLPSFLAALSACAVPKAVLPQVYQKETVVYLNAKGLRTSQKKAVEINQIIQFGDSVWEFNNYSADFPRKISFRSKDSEGKILNGRYIVYGPSGFADTIGNYSNGKRDGPWQILSSGQMTRMILYKDDQLLWQKDSVATQKKDTDESVAQFDGGDHAWLRFLAHTVRYPDDAINKNQMGTVTCAFVVDSAGHTADNAVWLIRSVCFSLDRETIRVILASPPWIPGRINGLPVSSTVKQPMVYRLERH